MPESCQFDWKVCIMKKLIVLFFFGLALTPAARSQGTFTAASCKQGDVNAVVHGPTHTAVNGDTIVIPPGSCTWTANITVPAGIGITIQGSGTPNSSPSVTGASASCSNTAITLTGVTAFIASPNFGASTLRLSCMALNYGSGPSKGFSILGSCTASGCPKLRVDNVTFNNWTGHAENGISYGITAVGDMFGVLDHNTINGTGNVYSQLVELSHASYQGVGFYGDNSWAQPEAYGSANFLFMENNIFNSAGCCENEGNAGGLTHQGGHRVVVRFNTYNQSDGYNFSMGWHGTESSGRPRGGRAWEFYQNLINFPSTCTPSGNCAPIVAVRSGTGLTWGNAIDSGTVNISAQGGVFGLNFLRAYGSVGGWPACDGTAAGDGNDPAGVQFTGTVGSFSGGVLTVSGASPGWATNQWVPAGAPYSLHDVTLSASAGLSIGSEILANGADTITLNSKGSFFSAPAVGDKITITRAFWCMDQGGGRGAGTLYSSSLTTAPYFSTHSNEVLSPAYFFLNSYTNKLPAGAPVQSDTARIIANRDYYTETVNQTAQTGATSPFNGTSGAGHGTLALRPTTCTTGVAYWATDEGNWNQSGSGGQGELYTCTATNTWMPSYTPFTYPHPLIVGGSTNSAPPDPPTGLQITVH
jgi:hypothetical protein